MVGSTECSLRVWKLVAPCLLSDKSLHLCSFAGIKIVEIKKEPQDRNRESHASLCTSR